MSLNSNATLLARIRRSSRLAIFMIMVFALKIGAVVACTTHDMLDYTGNASSSSTGMSWVDTVSSEDPTGNPFDFEGTCEHCGCHQTIAMVPTVEFLESLREGVAIGWVAIPTRHVLLPKELRPPIV